MARSKTLLSAAAATGADATLLLDEPAIGACVQVSGTFSGTVQFEGTIDGDNWVAVALVPLAANTTRTSTTAAAGIFAGFLPGVKAFRANVTSYASGSITVHANTLEAGDTIPTEIVASLGNANIASDAGIAGSKLATNARVQVSSVTDAMDLSGSAVPDTIWMHFNRAATLVSVYATYVEATSEDTGVAIDVGKQGDDGFFVAAYTSKPSAAAYSQEACTLANTAIAAGDTITYNCAGGKTGAGTVFLTAEFVFND
jgi:hypothetical protein